MFDSSGQDTFTDKWNTFKLTAVCCGNCTDFGLYKTNTRCLFWQGNETNVYFIINILVCFLFMTEVRECITNVVACVQSMNYWRNWRIITGAINELLHLIVSSLFNWKTICAHFLLFCLAIYKSHPQACTQLIAYLCCVSSYLVLELAGQRQAEEVLVSRTGWCSEVKHVAYSHTSLSTDKDAK